MDERGVIFSSTLHRLGRAMHYYVSNLIAFAGVLHQLTLSFKTLIFKKSLCKTKLEDKKAQIKRDNIG